MAFAENKNLRLLNLAYRKDINKIKISDANTFTHELFKTKVCHLLLEKNHKFVTEGIFLNGSRCDIFDITAGVVYEILHTEKLSSFLKKLDKYPREVEIIPIKTDIRYLDKGIIELDYKLREKVLS